MKMTMNQASRALGVSRKELKQRVRDGQIHTDEHGCIDCIELKELFPTAFQRAVEQDLDYYDALKETAGMWKDGAREQAEQIEKHHLVSMIRRLEAECYSLQKRVVDLESQLNTSK